MTAQSVTPQEQRDLIMRQVDDLRDFEHEYRTRLRAYLREQLRTLDEGSNPQGRPVELARLANLAIDQYASPELVAVALAAWAHESLHGEALDQAWDRYAEAVRLEQGVKDGTVTLQDIEPGLIVGDRQQVAREITRANSAAALDVLVRGAR